MSGLVVELMDCTRVLLEEIKRGAVQRDVAVTYSLALRSSYETDWGQVNRAIIARWSVSGFVRIKEAAWSGRWRGKPLVADGGTS